MKAYIDSREDDNVALFVTLDSPHERLKINGVEIRLRQLGRQLNLDRGLLQDASYSEVDYQIIRDDSLLPHGMGRNLVAGYSFNL